FLAKAKNRNTPVPGVPWQQAMTAHAGIHAGFVYVITMCWPMALLEFAFHWLIDDMKCRGELSINSYQLLHFMCKAFWAASADGDRVPLYERRHYMSRRAFVQQRPAPPFDVQGGLGGHRGRRGGCVMSFPMIDETFYLVLAMKNNGWGLTGRLTARQPSLSRNEICVELKVQVPKALFSRPALKALVSVPKDAPAGSPVITAEVANNVREL